MRESLKSQLWLSDVVKITYCKWPTDRTKEFAVRICSSICLEWFRDLIKGCWFCEGRKTEELGDKSSEQGWEPTKNSGHIWHWGQEAVLLQIVLLRVYFPYWAWFTCLCCTVVANGFRWFYQQMDSMVILQTITDFFFSLWWQPVIYRIKPKTGKEHEEQRYAIFRLLFIRRQGIWSGRTHKNSTCFECLLTYISREGLCENVRKVCK